MLKSESRGKKFLFSVLLSEVLFCSVVYLVLSAFHIEVLPVLPFTVGLLVIASCLLEEFFQKNGWMISAGWMLVSLLMAVIFPKEIFGGFAHLLNRVIDTYAQVHPANYRLFAAPEQVRISFLVTALSVLLAVACAQTVRWHAILFGVLCTVLLGGICAVFLPVLSPVWLTVAALTVLLLVFQGFVNGNHFQKSGITLNIWLRTGLVFVMVLTVLWAMAGVGRQPEGIRTLACLTREEIANLRYGSIKNTGLTEGNVANAGPRVMGEAPMLKVTMSDPASYYLRGFVGETYKDSRWEPLSAKPLYENRDMFNALHQNGFYPQGQITAAASALGEQVLQKENTVQIENIGLPSKFLYAPYEVMCHTAELDPESVGDSNIHAHGLRGQRLYTLQTSYNLVMQYQKIGAMLQRSGDNSAVAAYLQQEAQYNQFVYQQYLDIPADIDAYLSRALGNYQIEEGQIHFDYQKAKQNILYYLTTYVTYNENVGQTPENVDFVLNFLEGTKAGYSIHYASAAVMMFRYYGIPARFAEGYLVTKEDVKNAKPGDTMALDSSHAHAWAEYYQDGVGWLPFEATPSYISVMQQPDTYKPVTGLVGQAPETEKEDILQPEEIEQDAPPVLKSFWLKNRLTILLTLFLLGIAVLIGFFAGWLIYERRKTAKRKETFLSDDLHSAICGIFAYIVDVMVAEGLVPNNRPPEEEDYLLDEDLREEYRAVVAIWQEAKFSCNEMTEQQRKQVLKFKDAVWNRVWGRSGLLQRLQLKYLYFL